MSLIAELKRRNVFRVGIAYVLMGWVLLQGADFALDLIDAPNWVVQVFVIAVVIGLPIALFFAWAFEMTPEGIKKESEVDRSQSITPKTGRKLDFAIIGLLAIGMVYMLWDKFGDSGETTASPESEVATTQTTTEAAAAIKSIAVLPFVNMSSDPEQEFFSDGITEEILNALAQVPDLKVSGRTSSFSFKGKTQDLPTIGAALGVNHILEGSVRKSGDRVRITAQLIQVEDGFHMWSETYDRELTDVFAIQDEISAAILAELKAQLTGDQDITVAQVNLAVYDQYLVARQKIRERNEASLLEAAALLDRVIETDPAFAPAWAQRGITELMLADRFESYGTIPPLEASREGKRYLDEALRLESDLAEGLAGTGLYYNQLEENTQAVEFLERALLINPAMTDALNWLQSSFSKLGRNRDAFEITVRIHETDPLYLPGVMNLSVSYFITGQPDKINSMLERIRPFYQQGQANQVLVGVEAVGLAAAQRTADVIRVVQAQENPEQSQSAIFAFFNLFALMEYEASLAYSQGLPFQISALSRLGRFEEARMMGYQFLEQGVGTDALIGVLSEDEKHAEIVELVESRWSDLEDFEAAVPQRNGFGSDTLGRIALAYRATENQAGFETAMTHFRAALDTQIDQGANNAALAFSQAHFAMLANDQESAVLHLDTAVSLGWLEHPNFTDYAHAFKPLRGDPGFEAIMARMVTRLNEQRALLDLAPVDGSTET